MDQSPIFSRYEFPDYCGLEFDYQTNFTQFLQEARNGAHHGTSPTTTHLKRAENETEPLERDKKNRKSWKNSLLSWLKIDKKRKSNNRSTNTNSATVSKSRHGHEHFSGPVQGTVSGRVKRRPFSGPLIGFFGSRKEADVYKVKYMCLGQLDDHKKLDSYGPIYLVK